LPGAWQGGRELSGLASRTIKCGALCLFDFPNELAADTTGLAGAAVGEILLLKIPRAAVGMNEVTQAAATGCDGGKERFLDDGHEALQARERNLACRRTRVDAGAKQAFGCIDVADADNAVAIHERWLDGCLDTLEMIFKPQRIKGRVKRLDAELGEQGMLANIAREPQHRTKATRIAQAQGGVFKHQIDVIMFLRRRARRVRCVRFFIGQQAQAAGHAQVNEQMADTKIQQQVFCAAGDVDERLADKLSTRGVWQGVTQRGRIKVGAGKTAANKGWCDAAAGNFDFG